MTGSKKALTVSAATPGFYMGEAPQALMIMITLTNWFWIPFICVFDAKPRRKLHLSSSVRQSALARLIG
jgi:hypothetical protein